MSKIIGIDLGTTNSAVAIMETGSPKILENAEGARTTPSIVAISKTGERLVGLLAKRQAVTNPKNTIFGIKRFIGHSFGDEAVQKDKAIVPFEVLKSATNGVKVKMSDKEYSPEEISAMILSKLKTDVEAKIGQKVTQAIITVPAYFNDSQRQATKDAGAIAGLEVLRIINEPTAAALAYGFDKGKKEEKIVVFDFGGGTFDVSVLEVGDSVIEVKSTDGDSHLGGKDIDQKIINFLANQFKKESGIDLRGDTLALQRLDEAAEKAKIELSTAMESEVNIPFITSDASGPKHLLIKLSRAKLEELCTEFIDRAMSITKRAMEASGFKTSDIHEVILVGGQTRMPKMVEKVKAYFGKDPNKSINPDEVVALGAAIQGGILAGDVKDVLLLDVIPLSLGIETMGGVATKLVERNTTIPASRSQVFSTAADNQTSVEIHVVQGERAMAGDNKTLGRFILDGIPPAPRGMPQIEVMFDVDANGILSVKAKDKATSKEQSIRIEARSSLTKEEIEKMQKDAEAHASEDAKKREVVEAKNIGEQLIYTAEKSLADAGDKVPAELRKSIEDKITDLKSANANTTPDLESIKKATVALSNGLSKVGEIINKAAQEANKSAEAQTTTTDEKVRDADFEEKKPD
ncbi:MAG: molecular chaperone DnaK [Candidatus Zambryskibacteria bacterium RIFCSPLOWO2_02_FULL_39_26]|uniref:Chaperone protein DnaK n=1 Tax=Candidatus Zambryskibacteria bacterium RIFCSPLOWO2_12_FULL_39_23 TaxID=1802776 RepID=A0A1G2UQR9_9BACT|nr:MAG: molecular chaperone DnaK [Candidatus Zambryskibacteria bacterium RIFCSPHIGHO2_02_39_10]OHA99382.1 MAG: molecular chaperone DnaK [Candidatus Zambryskibacteria bacterium RIFCSPHIGHO2_12_FULL_39_47]OHB10372.1 MAG: molecular chaperone DnaK [Candidatus Zambryskibacteria bacterium RIFCSPLOWO2_02_FULL_39_26]OHB11727.1 MAG: molecular chaperone DnaK [Candidatus Zambryskibacteria bacterium RIFCSPLOWO2_12_FULL_39_23]